MSVASDWVVACQTAIVDRLTNKVSLIHVIEQVQMPKFPGVLPAFHVVVQWHNTTEMAVTTRLRIAIEDPASSSETSLLEEEVSFVGRVGHRSICIVHAMSVARAGSYRIVAQVQSEVGGAWTNGAGYPFVVVATVPPAVEA